MKPAPERGVKCNFHYHSTYTKSLYNVFYNVHTFNLSSLYDPDATGLGHQPMGFDFWSQMYLKYTVTGAKVRLRFGTIGVVNTYDYWVGWYLSETATPVTYDSFNSWQEDQRIKKRWYGNMIANQLQQKGQILKYSMRKFFKTKDIYANEFSGIDAFVGGTPTRNYYLHIFLWKNPSVAINVDIQMQMYCDIDFAVRMHDKVRDGTKDN